MPFCLISVQIRSFDGRDVQRRGHKLNHSVQKLLYALISVRRSAAYRNRLALAGGLSQNLFKLLVGRLLALQILHHQLVVQLTDLFYQLGAVQFCVIGHILRDIGDGNIIALIIIIDVGLHIEQVNDSFEIILLADRKL